MDINTNIEHPDYWDEMEKRQKEEIEEFGLVADFTHRQLTRPKTIINKKGEEIVVRVPSPQRLVYDTPMYNFSRPTRFWKGKTIVYLYTPRVYNELKQYRKDNPGASTIQFEPKVTGQAFCSHLDNFNKQKGRVVATEKALEQLRR